MIGCHAVQTVVWPVRVCWDTQTENKYNGACGRTCGHTCGHTCGQTGPWGPLQVAWRINRKKSILKVLCECVGAFRELIFRAGRITMHQKKFETMLPHCCHASRERRPLLLCVIGI